MHQKPRVPVGSVCWKHSLRKYQQRKNRAYFVSSVHHCNLNQIIYCQYLTNYNIHLCCSFIGRFYMDYYGSFTNIFCLYAKFLSVCAEKWAVTSRDLFTVITNTSKWCDMHIQSFYLKPVYAKNLCSYWTHVTIIYRVLFLSLPFLFEAFFFNLFLWALPVTSLLQRNTASSANLNAGVCLCRILF